MRRALQAVVSRRRRAVILATATPSVSQSTLTADAATFTGNGTDNITDTYTPKDAAGVTLTGQAWTAVVERVLLSAGNSTVGAAPGSIANDGVASSTISVYVEDADGYPAPNVVVTLAATGTGNTLTQPASPTNASGIATGSIVSTSAETKTVSATVNGLAVTATASVIVTGGAIAHPNEPSNMTQAFDEPWNTTPNGRTGTDWITDGSGTNFTIVTDATAPKSASNVLQVAYPTGFGAGFSPAQAYYAETAGMPANTQGVLYMHAHIKISANWTDNGNSGTKFVFPRPHSGEGGGAAVQTNHLFRLTVSDALDFGFITQLNGTEVEYLTGANLAKNVWHSMEFVATLGTSGSANDGTVKVWANGTQILNVANVKMLADGQSIGNGWKYLFLDPTYGGGVNTPPADLNFQIDHWYASVK